jgi:predicted DNA-binding transcriptional regulator YafY
VPAVPWEAGEAEMIATVRFDPSISWWAVRQLTDRATTAEDPDGGVTATIPVGSVDAFVGWMIGLEDQAEIVGPPELRERLIDHVRGTA